MHSFCPKILFVWIDYWIGEEGITNRVPKAVLRKRGLLQGEAVTTCEVIYEYGTTMTTDIDAQLTARPKLG